MSIAEILSPAGSMESFKAAINAGADAVYFGGNMFGARAFANNFDAKQLLEAIDYAHIHDVRVYLTVNTLLKNTEIQNSLYQFLRPAYEHGLDAVIVQDLGVFEFVRRHFPGMDIHASTQMTTNSYWSASLLEQMGASRVVTSREMSLEEIKKIREHTGIEIESFVHGALCYCYSGQCLMSSMIGGRSGNRGRCAQPCRLPYEVIDGKGRSISSKGRYLLSPKDICALEILPDVIEAGVYSLKIEGRMKSPQYTAGVVSIYRKYLDLYEKVGKERYQVDEQDLHDLMDLFNRGNFSKGYYISHNGPDMMSMKRPNHQGTAAIEVMEAAKGRMKVRALEELYPQDIVDVSADFTWTNGQTRKTGEVFSINLPNTLKVRNREVFYRVRNNQLLNRISEKYILTNRRESIDISGTFAVGKPMALKAVCRNVSVEVVGNVVQEATNRPMDESAIKKQLTKLGTTQFEAHSIRILMEGDVFVPVQELNELRRELIRQLEEHLVTRRSVSDEETVVFTKDKDMTGKKEFLPDIHVTVSDLKQLQVVCEFEPVRKIYFDMALSGFEQLKEAVNTAHQAKKKIYLMLPHIFRLATVRQFEQKLEYLKGLAFDGFVVKNLDEYQFLRANGLDKSMVCDYSIYHFNDWMEQNSCFDSSVSFTVPLELSASEISHMDHHKSELIVFGYLPVMVSAQCTMKNTKGCQKNKDFEETTLFLKDRVGEKMQVVNYCKWCYNIIYGSGCINLLPHWQKVEECGVYAVRFELGRFEATKIRTILTQALDFLIHKKYSEFQGDYTSGHFLRGIE